MPHSQAKLELYQKYLERYLNVLVASNRFKSVNVYDVFCGSGIYKDGKAGSPILAFEAIRQNRKWCSDNGKHPTPISLTVNDGKPKKANQVEGFLNSLNQDAICHITCHCLEAEKIFNTVIKEVNSKGKDERNLVFIDPYGYKDINANSLKAILQNRVTEIILFLPVSFIYRFADYALTEAEQIQYEALRNFIFDFFPENHPVRNSQATNNQEFIRYVRDALSFQEEFFSASYYIERDKSSYFAIFFISSNILGLEKFLETRWSLDPTRGEGFKLPTIQLNAFEQQFQEMDKEDGINQFAEMLEKFMKVKSRDNSEVYLFTLRNGFLPKHANEILSAWQERKRLTVWNVHDNKEAPKKSFYVNYDNTYRNSDSKKKVTFKLN